ncbi:hypothetical protein LOK49_LG07G00367 [Camellia lanceoleosa]|uniref:Uncharacterized protein n=1 Tax=Camellia lanceoleosa TaxID=1840588 RepID=A0ACC0GZV0_9ERIC|nr:hypothetical protein LOK49_LG07G00367 [Camellia lanceoleosa]
MLTIGASDEQLDVFNEVWYVMLLNTGQAIEAIEVIGKRIKMMEGAPFMWRLLERGYANGREAGSYCWRAFIAATMDEEEMHHSEF